ncbi:MAG: peptidase M4 family protein [Sphingobacteriales bacterium]|nr:peptidase M4 family protein [Sphingobacteriales bacterium]
MVYSKESGAINEGLSDIWGAMVEFFAAPEKQTYLMGEDFCISEDALRSMSNPKLFDQPDTYGGTNWFDVNGTNSYDHWGVHTNSGVMNHWFFLLAEGGNDTNDNGDAYNVAGLGKLKAANIVYRAETVYFTATTNYLQARAGTIAAAQDLYGANSTESLQVALAWYAVGVGYNPTGSHYIVGPTQLTPGYVASYTLANPYYNATN